MSFTEFSYQLLQAYDFLVLHDRDRCVLQMGGTDQWGNITAGCELVRKVRGAQVHGLVWPLLTTAGGAKFGKTEGGAVWLDASRTSPFRFYQFWMNSEDRDVITYLKFFTFKSQDEIAGLERETNEHPERREAQRELARAVTAMVHGAEPVARAERGAGAGAGAAVVRGADQVARAERAAEVLFGGPLASAQVEDILMVFDDAPS